MLSFERSAPLAALRVRGRVGASTTLLSRTNAFRLSDDTCAPDKGAPNERSECMKRVAMMCVVLFAGCAAEMSAEDGAEIVDEVGVKAEAICDTVAAPGRAQAAAWEYYHWSQNCRIYTSSKKYSNCGPATGAQFALELTNQTYVNGQTITYDVKRTAPNEPTRPNWSKVSCGCQTMPGACTFVPH